MPDNEMKALQENWAETMKELVSQSKEQALTLRGLTLGPGQGLFESNDTMAAAARPWFEMTRTTHDRWLEIWEGQSNAAIDNICRLNRE